MRRIVLEDKKITESPRLFPKYRQRFCLICQKWYRCKDDRAAERHKDGGAHKRAWKKSVGLL